MFGKMVQGWINQKAYEGGAKLTFDRSVDKNAHLYGPGGTEYAKGRFRELLQQGADASRAAQIAGAEAIERFPPQQ